MSILPVCERFGYCHAMIVTTPQEKIELTALDLEGVALSTIVAVIGDVRYQYLSGPITGGRGLLDWHEAVGRTTAETDYRTAKDLSVVKKNITLVRQAAEREREAGRSTIEPGSFEANFTHWEQDDFLHFWENVIARHASGVRFMDGWQFSSGCAFEYLCARRHGRPTWDIEGRELSPENAVSLLDDALAEIGVRHDASDPRDAQIASLYARIGSYRRKIAALG